MNNNKEAVQGSNAQRSDSSRDIKNDSLDQNRNSESSSQGRSAGTSSSQDKSSKADMPSGKKDREF